MKKNKKTAIITGSEGYLGNVFIKELKKKKIHVIKLDKLNKNLIYIKFYYCVT